MATTALSLFPSHVAAVTEDRKFTPEVLRSLNDVLGRIGGTSGSSGGIAPAIGGVSIPNFTMSPTTPTTRRWEYPSTNPNTWNVGAGMMTFKGKVTFVDYFAENPSAHAIVGLRCDLDVISTEPRFHGVVFGNLIGAVEGVQWAPAAQIESRATGLDPGHPLRQLLPLGVTPQDKLLRDNVEYDILIQSLLINSDRRAIRMVISEYDAAHLCYNLVVDTGACLDPNTYLEMNKTGLVFASVFESASTAWSIDWTDMTVTWGPAPDLATDATTRVDRYGAEVEGDLTFVGDGRRMKVLCTGATIDNWSAIQSQTTDGNTSLLSIPNGTATASNYVAANNSSLTNFSYAAYGIEGNRAVIETVGIGTGVTPPLDVRIGADVITSITATGQDLDGDFTFTGTGHTLYVYSQGTTLADWTTVKSQTADGDTSLLAVPNGTATTAAFVATNTSDVANASYISLSTNGARNQIDSAALGTGATLPIDIKIGGTAVASVTSSGIDLAGDLTFTGTARSLYVYCTTTTFSNWTAVKSQTTNGNTSLFTVPNGTATAANFLAANSSSLTNFSYLSVGTNGSRNLIESGSVGTGTNNPLDVKIGGSTHTFGTTGLLLAGKSAYIGPASTRLVGPTNLGGANAMAFSGAFNYETVCTVGYLSGLMGAYNAVTFENIIRPIYCHLSQHFADGKANGTA